MTKRQIVEDLARRRVVETMVENIARRSAASPELKDLCQMVYVILLEYDETKVRDLYDNGEIGFFIARVIINQFRSNTSPYFYQIKRFIENARPIEGHDIPGR